MSCFLTVLIYSYNCFFFKSITDFEKKNVENLPIVSKSINGLVRPRQYMYDQMVQPYAYGRTIRVYAYCSKYFNGLEHNHG